MLPVILLERDEELRRALGGAVLEHALASGCPVRIVMSTDTHVEADKAAQDVEGAVLFMAGLTSENVNDAARLARRMLERCRDSYPVFWVRQSGVLERMLRVCPRPAGVLLPPITAERAKETLTSVFLDYAELMSPRQERILLDFGSSARRLPRESVTHIEARDKKIILYTSRQCFCVYGTITDMEAKLGSAFLRCHRAFLVNPRLIESVDFASLTITVRGGASVPISRARREDIRQYLDAENHSRPENDRPSENGTPGTVLGTMTL
ncbi:MAG: LytTR family transcriptional regulator DNA-binding domain-containing protein [Oscillospiraceae bacterium]|nr:LytTR family transcriptional regulator DNA-binding domain-containing protein [Oscillospiraceae bacterium]